MRHFWMDRLVEIERGVRAVAVKAVSLSEDVLHDHFPGNPVMPGVLLVEGMAQAAGLLLTDASDGERVAVMVSLDRARFAGFARPGDLVRMTVEVESLAEDSARVRGRATVGEREVAAARFTFRLFPVGAVIPPVYQEVWRQTLAMWRGQYPELRDE